MFVGSAKPEHVLKLQVRSKLNMKNNKKVRLTSTEASRGLIPTAFGAFAKITHVKPRFGSLRNLLLSVPLAVGLTTGSAALARPSIQSIQVSPNPLISGQNFTITVTASPGVTQGTAIVDFQPGRQSLEVPLTGGQILTGSGLMPTAFENPERTRARVTVVLLDSAGQVAKETVHVDVKVELISAFFSGGVLTIFGDDLSNAITVGRDAAGTILVNGGAVPVQGGVPTTNNTTRIQMIGLNGGDVLLVDDANGPMPRAILLGGEGSDSLTGSGNVDELDGGPGDDELSGRGGDDLVMGGPGDDNLNGGRGTDRFFGGEGDDVIVWLPGEGSDLVEGEEGQDTLLFVGAVLNPEVEVEGVGLEAVGQRLHFTRSPGNITMDCDGVERVEFEAVGGRDIVLVRNSLAGTQVKDIVVNLGPADDVLDFVEVHGTFTNDVFTVTSSTNGVSVVNQEVTLTIVGSDSNDDLLFFLEDGDDTLDASGLAEGFFSLLGVGRNGDDVLIGSAGDDRLDGEAGDDTLQGGPGLDELNGGTGNNIIIQD